MSSLLFEVSAIHPAIYPVMAVLLLSSAALACWVPSRRAAGEIDLLAEDSGDRMHWAPSTAAPNSSSTASRSLPSWQRVSPTLVRSVA
jgi:hypothetical protein